MIALTTPDSFDETNFIPAIDADTEELSATDVFAVDKLPAGNAMLLVQQGPEAGSRFLLDQDEVLAGRHPECDIFLDDISVSRRHASFTRTAGGFAVTDLGSLNGTYVNRDRIDGQITLTGGDEVRLGKYRLIYFNGGSNAGGGQ